MPPFLAVLLGIFTFKETLPKHLRRELPEFLGGKAAKTQYDRLPAAEHGNPARPPHKDGFWTAFGRPQLFIVGYFSLLVFQIVSFLTIEILVLFTPRSSGGLGMSIRKLHFERRCLKQRNRGSLVINRSDRVLRRTAPHWHCVLRILYLPLLKTTFSAQRHHATLFLVLQLDRDLVDVYLVCIQKRSHRSADLDQLDDSHGE